jgi:hypothetical protein
VKSLWPLDDTSAWKSALDRYDDVVANQRVPALAALDRWYRDELPGAIPARKRPHVTHAEIVKATEWKMARGVWRARNLVLVKSNDPKLVIDTSTNALATIPHPTAPITSLTELAGVGPATASAIASAASPETYPFFDELVAAQVPGLGKVAWTLGYYRKYAEALRARAAKLGGRWTPVMVERALWSHVGGKAGVSPGVRRSRS